MRVVEKFVSVNGEGRRAGQLALFIRFAGCNLNCKYCDTRWANAADVEYTEYTPEELVDIILKSGIDNVTLTGGEPLLQDGLADMLKLLDRKRTPKLSVELETNGSVDVAPIRELGFDFITFTLDYKTGASGMEERMCMENFCGVRASDTVKFVVGSRADLLRSKEIIDTYRLVEKGCGIYLSPCYGEIEPRNIVEFMTEEKMNGVNVQLQLHKYIWDPNERGV